MAKVARMCSCMCDYVSVQDGNRLSGVASVLSGDGFFSTVNGYYACSLPGIFGFYAVALLKDGGGAKVMFVSPESVVDSTMAERLCGAERVLFFDRMFVENSVVRKNIERCSFFCYNAAETVLLDEYAYGVLSCYMNRICKEVKNETDAMTRRLVALYVDILLDYCRRFAEVDMKRREEELWPLELEMRKNNTTKAIESLAGKSGHSVAFLRDVHAFFEKKNTLNLQHKT